MSSSILTKALSGVISAGATAAVPRALATVAAGASFTLPGLPYDAGALEPHISGQIMEIHHKKHHQGVCAPSRRRKLLVRRMQPRPLAQPTSRTLTLLWRST